MVALPMYHIFVICTTIGSPVRGGLPHQEAVLANIIYVWYYAHTLVIRSDFFGQTMMSRHQKIQYAQHSVQVQVSVQN